MQVFQLDCVDTAPLLTTSLENQKMLFRSGGISDAKRYDGVWIPPHVSRFKRPRERKIKPFCDVSLLLAHADAPIFSERAKAVFEPILRDSVQWLELDCDEGKYWILNTLETVDLDLSKSRLVTFGDGTTGPVKQYAFRSEDLLNKWVFKTRKHTFRVLCTEPVRELVAAHKLTGFHFTLVWDSLYEPFPEGLDNKTDVKGRPEIYGPNGIKPLNKEYRKQFWPLDWFELESAKK